MYLLKYRLGYKGNIWKTRNYNRRRGRGSVEHSEQLIVTPSINKSQKLGDTHDGGYQTRMNARSKGASVRYIIRRVQGWSPLGKPGVN